MTEDAFKVLLKDLSLKNGGLVFVKAQARVPDSFFAVYLEMDHMGAHFQIAKREVRVIPLEKVQEMRNVDLLDLLGSLNLLRASNLGSA